MTCPDCGSDMPVQIYHSAAGYYIGRWCDQCGPWELLSADYYKTREDAELAMATEYDTREYALENQE
jgi:hypothetical protein